MKPARGRNSAPLILANKSLFFGKLAEMSPLYGGENPPPSGILPLKGRKWIKLYPLDISKLVIQGKGVSPFGTIFVKIF